MLAKPFLCSLDGHKDGIQCMAKHPSALSLMFSGAYDGEVSALIRLIQIFAVSLYKLLGFTYYIWT